MELPTLDVSEENQRELDELRQDPEIAAIRGNLRKNRAIAEILFHSSIAYVTQGLRAEQNAKAFKNLLKPEELEERMKPEAEQLMRDHAEFAEKEGVTSEDLVKELTSVWIYYRLTHPILQKLEDSISRIEGAEATVALPSGLSALDVLVDQFTKSAGLVRVKKFNEEKGEDEEKEIQGELLQYPEWKGWETIEKIQASQIVVVGAIYGGSYAQFVKRMEQQGKRVIFMTITDFVKKGCPDGTDFIYGETSNNPILRVAPIKKMVEERDRLQAAQPGRRVILALDDTFTTGTTQPIQHGADFSVNSATKYYNGRSEDMGGFISAKNGEDLAKTCGLAYGERMVDGPVMSLSVVRNFLKNIQDLYERLFLATKNARVVKKIAEKYGLDVRYIESDDILGYADRYAAIKNPKIPKSISNGMIVVDFKSAPNARIASDALEDGGIGKSCVSLGGVHTYYCIPSETTHSELSAEGQKKARIEPGMLRISCGIEEDLPAKFEEVCKGLFSRDDAMMVA